MACLKLDLQRLATQTTLLSDSGNDLSPEMKTFYDKQLLKDAKVNLVHDQFGQKRNIPKGGGKVIEFRKFSSLPKATSPLTEGVTPNGNKLNVTAITKEIAQFGDYVEMSDILQLAAIDNVLVETTEKLGTQAGLTLDTIVRNELNAGTNVLWAPKVAAGVETAVASRKALTKECLMTPKLAFKAAAILKGVNAKKINGDYVAIAHPHVIYDIMMEAGDTWLTVNQYKNPEKIYNGEVGKLGGLRFVESTEAKIWKDDTCPTGLAVYSVLVLGADSYGTIEIEGGGLQHIYNPPGSGNDPLKQRSSVGWKAIKAAKILNDEYILRIECCSSFSDTDSAN